MTARRRTPKIPKSALKDIGAIDELVAGRIADGSLPEGVSVEAAIEAVQFYKLALLGTALGFKDPISQAWWLALKIAEAFVPGFSLGAGTSARPAGRPKGTGTIDRWRLCEAVGKMRAADPTRSIKSITSELSKPKRGDTPTNMFKGEKANSLATTYYRTLEQWNALPDELKNSL